MSRADIPVQCTRCRNKHMESTRTMLPRGNSRGIAMSESLCPRCSCKSFFDLTPQVAWCWASGLIEIGDAMPPDGVNGGPILIASGPKAALKGKLSVLARHGRGASSGKLLVPGVPEAENQRAAGDALAEWLTWCGKRKSKDGVVFMQEKTA